MTNVKPLGAFGPRNRAEFDLDRAKFCRVFASSPIAVAVELSLTLAPLARKLSMGAAVSAATAVATTIRGCGGTFPSR